MGCVCTDGVNVCLGRDGSIGVEGETVCVMVCVWRVVSQQDKVVCSRHTIVSVVTGFKQR